MTHIARGLDSDGGLLLDIVVNGHILQLPSDASIIIKVNEWDAAVHNSWLFLCGILEIQ